jgi:chorismate synthase
MGTLRFLTAGESHGKALTVIVEGVPAGLFLNEEHIAKQLARRQHGYGRGERMAIERDRAEILSGVRHGVTIGSPISLLISNRDWPNWQDIMGVEPVDRETERVTRVRPGHADLAGAVKYSQDDVRNVLERASARETAARVAAGSVAMRFLEEFGIRIHSHVIAIGDVHVQAKGDIDWQSVETSPVRCADPKAAAEMMEAIDKAREAGDTVGGIAEVVAEGVPIGLGSHVHWDRRIDGRIAQALMSIPACKGVSIGEGWQVAGLHGSEAHDVIEPVSDPSTGSGHGPSQPWQRRTNRAGGTEGGITNGMPLLARIAMKPIPTLAKPLPSVDLDTGERVEAHRERADICVVPAAGVIGEAMVALVLADAFLEKFGGDHIDEARRNYEAYLKTIGPRKRS